MKVLVACEESQLVAIAFRELGHEAYSCDIESSSGGHPEWHLQGDVTPLLKQKWDMIIAFPPCTFLCSSGMHWTVRGLRDRKLTDDALKFVKMIWNTDCPRIAIENPVGILSKEIRKPDQIIQPWMFGDDASKSTCLWLKGLPKLTTDNGGGYDHLMDGKMLTLIFTVRKSQRMSITLSRKMDLCSPGKSRCRNSILYGAIRRLRDKTNSHQAQREPRNDLKHIRELPNVWRRHGVRSSEFI